MATRSEPGVNQGRDPVTRLRAAQASSAEVARRTDKLLQEL
jgi:hypothetical protein